jgi:hypothetical protein
MKLDLVKRFSLWIIFSFFYVSGLEMALQLSIDAQQDPNLLNTVLYTFMFNLLVGHLIVKYEKLWSLFCSTLVGAFGIVGFGYFFTEQLIDYSKELKLALVLSLPFATFVVIELNKLIDKQQAE